MHGVWLCLLVVVVVVLWRLSLLPVSRGAGMLLMPCVLRRYHASCLTITPTLPMAATLTQRPTHSSNINDKKAILRNVGRCSLPCERALLATAFLVCALRIAVELCVPTSEAPDGTIPSHQHRLAHEALMIPDRDILFRLHQEAAVDELGNESWYPTLSVDCRVEGLQTRA